MKSRFEHGPDDLLVTYFAMIEILLALVSAIMLGGALRAIPPLD